jgi:hypothetical protein
VWVTAHREEIPISELDNDHLVNILRLLERKPHFRQDTYPHIMAEAVKRGLVKPPATRHPGRRHPRRAQAERHGQPLDRDEAGAVDSRST